MASTLRQWTEDTYPGVEPTIVALREAVRSMVMLTNAMLLVTTQRPPSSTLVEDAITCARTLVVDLEALHTRVVPRA